MNEHEDQVSRLLTAVAGRQPATRPPIADLIVGGRVIERRKRRVAVLVTVVAVLAVATTAAVIAEVRQDGGSVEPAVGAGDWEPLPPSPLSPRGNSIAAWTGSEALFIGGQSTPDCEDFTCPALDPPDEVDGAAYDPATRSWRTISLAPYPLSNRYPSTVVGDRVVVAADNGQDAEWLMYDASDDRWTILPSPPHASREPGLSSADGIVYTMSGVPSEQANVYSLDPDIGTWSALQARPDPGGIVTGRLIATDFGPAVIGLEAPATTEDALVTVDLYEALSWRRIVATDVTTGEPWYWTGGLLIAPVPDLNHTPGDAPGAALDPGSSTFLDLLEGPDLDDAGWPVRAAAGPLVAANGFIYDDEHQQWLVTPLPPSDPSEPSPLNGMAAVWADGTLITFGGFTNFHMGPNSRQVSFEDPTDQVWSLTPDLKPRPAADARPATLDDIVDVHWTPLPTYTRGRETASYVTFDADGTWTGSDGCNHLSGSFEIHDGDLSATSGPQTLVGCVGVSSNAILDVADQLLIDGQYLDAVADDGSLLMEYDRGPAPGRAGGGG